MRLKHVKLAGFKSFVDPTTVTFPGNRCAVVGPNGCGKSNIIDAVRWVMGESSAKQLRGESLTDVIFNGSNTRKPTVVASIELVFDNSDRRIGGEYAAYSEIAIRRQVNREAQSTYYLNGTKCRRRDILDIFLGTGFGPRSYSIIEQGMISQLVEAKPDDLRTYLEEAAGISKYKERRRETENRIRHTQENLDRLNDLREELERQLAHLKRQARAAERFRELKEEERRLTAELHGLMLTAQDAELEQRQARISELETLVEQVTAERQGAETATVTAREQREESNEQFNEVQGRFYRLGAEIARLEEAIQFNEERVRQLAQDLETVQQRRSEAARQLEMDDGEIARLRGELETVTPQVEEATENDRAAAEALQALEADEQRWQASWEAFSGRAAENQRTAEVQASRVEHLGQVLQRLRARSAQLEADEQGVPVVPGAEVATLAEGITQLEADLRAHDVDLDRCLNDLAAAREDLLLKEQVLEDGRGEVQNLRHELASLQAVQQAALGRDYSETAGWLEEQGLAGAQRLGESLAVVPGWEQAVETVLASDLQALQVPNAAVYVDALASLPAGEVTLLEGTCAPEQENADLPTLASLVRSDGVSLGGLLAGILVADSVETALAHRRKLAAGQSIITRSGLWFGPDWLRMSRREGDASGVIERGQLLEELTLQVEEAEKSLAELQGGAQAGRDRVTQLESERARLQERLAQLNAELGKLRTDHGVHQVRMEEADARRRRMAQEREELAGQIAAEQERLDASRGELTRLEVERETMAGERATLTENRDAATAALTVARQRARETRDAFHNLNGQAQNLRSRLTASETARERLVAQRSELDEREASLRAGIETSNTPIPELRQELETQLASRHTVEQELATVRARLDELDGQIRKLEADRNGADGRLTDVRGKLETARVERQGVVVSRQNTQEQFDATGFELAMIRAELAEDASVPVWRESLEKLGQRITRLGPINLAAIEEFDQQSERKVYLDAQYEDLTTALETLQAAIRKIDKETRSRFKETFDAVNTRLGELFPKVFGGGHAYLELTGEDLLDTGVSLMARPPGKRNASVHLLSGGEKAMTAVALIFAIFQLNPSPVCLLDEVDAPLDDSNVVRFANLIKDMSADVQFVVITHNKITMEMADHLMGVTMHEPGVSRLVSVDVEEASALAAV